MIGETISRVKRFISRYIGKAVSRLLLFTSIYIVIVIAVVIIMQVQRYKRADDTYVMLQDNVYQNGIVDWEALAGTETVAWLVFKDKPEKINYPVVQHKTNSYYTTHLYNGEKNISGAIFMDKRNAPMLTDRNTIIYGHNMQDGTMFHDLRYFMDPNFYKDNKEFYLYLPDGTKHTYEICTVNQISENSFAYDITYSSDTDFIENMNMLYQTSMCGNSVKTLPTDSIVTLSTCMTNDITSSDRLIVVGIHRTVEQVQQPASWYVVPGELGDILPDASGDASGEADDAGDSTNNDDAIVDNNNEAADNQSGQPGE